MTFFLRGATPMPRQARLVLASLCLLGLPIARAAADDAAKKPLQPMDVFKLEYADDPQIAPDGKRIVYVRNFMDVMKDRQRSNLWIINVDGSGHEALTSGSQRDGAPRWSRDSKRIAYISDAGGTPQLHCRWVDSGRSAQLTHGGTPLFGPSWSPDGKHIAFAMNVPEPAPPF